MMYSIKELADLSGSTTGTLRYYDRLELLKPAAVGENGYRYYDRESLLTLQQILFYKELGLPLKEIQFLLRQPDFQLLQSLKKHHQSITQKINRYSELLETIERTINALEGETSMSPEDYFSGFDDKQYEGEARQLWGDTPQYQESHQKWSSYSEAQKEHIKNLGKEITLRMVPEDSSVEPDDLDVQAAVGDYYQYLNKYFYHCDLDFLKNLADMWVQDSRFAVNYERIRQGGAEFVREAVQLYCERSKEG